MQEKASEGVKYEDAMDKRSISTLREKKLIAHC